MLHDRFGWELLLCRCVPFIFFFLQGVGNPIKVIGSIRVLLRIGF